MGIGKWIGGALGFITAGPLGILAGIILGSLFDASMEQLSGTYQPPADGTNNEGERNSFLFSLLVMASYIIKADGKVMHSEMEYVRRFLRTNFGEMAVSEGEDILLRLFEERKRREQENPQAFRQIIRDCGGQIARQMRYEERLQLLAFLAEIAKADGSVHEKELNILRDLAQYLRLNASIIDQMFALGSNTLEDAYKVLGITPDATDDEVRKAYKKMVIQHLLSKVYRYEKVL